MPFPVVTPTEAVVDPKTMRGAMGRFTTGVAVVTTLADGEPHGMTVNSLTSVSLDPPLLLICLLSEARTTEAATTAGRFAVNILSARQDQIALRFARGGQNHFAGLPLTYGHHNVPIVPDALAHLECTIDRHFPAGDHEVIIGQAHRVCERDGEPLAFLAGRFGEYIAHDHEPIQWLF